MKISLCTWVLSICFSMLVKAESGSAQFWLVNSVSQKLDYSLLLSLETENRFYAEGSFHRRYELRPLITWQYSPRYDFTIGYQNSATDSNQADLEMGHQCILANTIKWDFADYRLTSRQQLQLGEESADTVLLSRHRLLLSWMNDHLPLRLKPFIANEWFFDLENGDLRENRFWGGVRYKINNSLDIALFGMRRDQWNRLDQHTTSPVTGLTLNIKF
ncbi:MAG: DUF2490 domain-containing protein [Verrucomicrobiota bacterium]